MMLSKVDLKIGIVLLIFAILFAGLMVPTISDKWREASTADVEFFTVGPRFFPYLAASIIGLLSIIMIIDSRLKLRSGDSESFAPITKAQLKPVSVFIGIGILYILLLPYLGVIIATPLCLTVYFWYFELRNWIWIAALSIGTTLIVYLCFAKLMMVPLPMGFLE